MKTILFIVNHSAQLKAPLKLILLLKENLNYKPLVYLNFSGGWNLWKEVEICQKNQIHFICDTEGQKQLEKGIDKGSEATSPYFSTVKNREPSFKDRIKLFLLDFFSILVIVRFLNKKIKELEKILIANEISILVLPEDAYGVHPLFNKAAKKLNIPTVLIPFTKSNHLEVLNDYQLVEVNGLNRLYCYISPKWEILYKDRFYMPFSLLKALTLDIVKVSPLNPFVLMGGRADLMLVENEDDIHYYQEAGINLKKMLKTGAIYQDTFHHIIFNYEERKAELFKRYNILCSKPVILCTLFPVATPINDEYGVYDYGTVENAISFWLKPLLECNQFQLWVHPHPRTNINFIKYLEGWHLKVMYEPIETILPFCDIHISGTSATTRMSLTLGKPILCYTDNYVFTDLEKFKGTVTVKTRAEYVNLIAKLKSDFSFFEKLKEEAKANIELFGPMDGKSGERILKVFESIKPI